MRAKLSQEFAAHCDLDRTYISGIERGMRNVALRNIEKIARALRTSLSELMRVSLSLNPKEDRIDANLVVSAGHSITAGALGRLPEIPSRDDRVLLSSRLARAANAAEYCTATIMSQPMP
jgi:transcriptional regulator with XRE-family HTH domain